MNRGQHYARLDTCKLALNTCADILAIHIGDHSYNDKVILAANNLAERALAEINDAMVNTEFEELESDEED